MYQQFMQNTSRSELQRKKLYDIDNIQYIRYFNIIPSINNIELPDGIYLLRFTKDDNETIITDQIVVTN